MAMSRCGSCPGFSPSDAQACVHCGGALKRRSTLRKGMFGVVGASIASLTLMACYGGPPCEDGKPDGGDNSNRCLNYEPDSGTVQNHGDSGVTDGGVTDAGVDGGP